MNLPEVNTPWLLANLSELLNIPSPTGFTAQAIAHARDTFSAFPVELCETRKGALLAIWRVDDTRPASGVTAHVDTLGAMVREIKGNGRLKLTKIGGFAWNTVEGEGCTVFTAAGERVRGSLLLTKASGHIHGGAVVDTKREDDAMEVRLDARVLSAEDTRRLGIGVGDFVAFDPRVELTEGFVRSRHLDNKAGVACIAAAFKAIAEAGLRPSRTISALISNYEEVGHGASTGFGLDVDEVLCVDMAAVGEGQASDEFSCTLCLKDSRGPYHHGFSQKLRRLAAEANIPFKTDTYPYYGSDGEAFWAAGADTAVGLIGPGVDASHNYERTHTEALLATTRWIMAWILAG